MLFSFEGVAVAEYEQPVRWTSNNLPLLKFLDLDLHLTEASPLQHFPFLQPSILLFSCPKTKKKITSYYSFIT
jgi:hypothetical protein